MFLFTPLEQFNQTPLLSLQVFSFDLTITQSTLILSLAILLCFLFLELLFLDECGFHIPNRWLLIFESFYDLCMTLVKDSIKGNIAQRYFSFIFVLFLFILICNLVGMVPYSFTPTSHLSFTLALSIMVFFGYHLICLREHGVRAFSLYYPSGVSLNLAPLIVPIELLARCSQVISLSVRLFANMMAGHTLLKVIAGFAWKMMFGGTFLFIAHIGTLAVLTILIGLELSVAFIQAYVFVVLASIYINDAHNLH